MIAIVVAIARNGVIGKDGKLPWRLPADLLMFKHLTMGQAVVMGRKTYESIGKTLPGRLNIVLTRDKNYLAPGCIIADSANAALSAAKDCGVYIIGGAEVYKRFLKVANQMHLTFIDEDFEGDAYFPPVDWSEWKEIKYLKGVKNEKNPHDFCFRVFERIK